MSQKSSFLSRFTPSLMTPEALEAVFVQRQELARKILDRIRVCAMYRSQRHTLVTGWHEHCGGFEELRRPLCLLDSAISYRSARDLRTLVELPLEERVLLESLLGVAVQATA